MYLRKLSSFFGILRQGFKNVKVVHSIIFLSVAAIIATSVISATGYSAMKKINHNIDIMYNKNLIPIVKIGELKNNFFVLRYNMSMAAESKFYYEYEKDIKNNDTAINTNIEVYEDLISDKNQREYIDRLKKDYKEYMLIWEAIKTAAKDNKKLSSTELTRKKTLELNIINYFDGLIKYNNMTADNLNKSSEDIYRKNLDIFTYITTAAVILLLLLTLAIIKTINTSIKDMINHLNLISQGNFTANINTASKNDFGMMKKSLNGMMNNISGMLKLVKENCDSIALHYQSLSNVSNTMNETSGEVALAIHEVSSGSLSQSENLSGIDASITQLGSELENVLIFMEEARTNAEATGNKASEGNDGLNRLIEMVEDINTSFGQISSKILNLGKKINEVNHITSLINSIADQTNLLALNAAIEAARAGEAGKGFSVVANEVRKLSEQAKGASQNIHSLLQEISMETNSVVNTTSISSEHLNTQVEGMNGTISSFKEIIDAIGNILPQINNASKLVFELNNNKNYVIEKVRQTNVVSQENAALSQQISASTQEMHSASEEVTHTIQQLKDMTDKMKEQVNKFRL